jgi:hypothetical protein
VFAFKLGRDASNRAFPESGYKGAFHSASHHQEKEDRIVDFAKINKYHVSMIPYFLEKLKNTPDGDGSLLDNSVVLYGSPMGDSNVHNHKRVPLFLAGHAGGALKGNLHIKAADGTPLANAMLAMAQKLDQGGTAPTVGAAPSRGPGSGPVAGANSFTEGQAKSRIESQGFTNLSGLTKDDQGIWRGKAMKDGRNVNVSLDFHGDVFAQ